MKLNGNTSKRSAAAKREAADFAAQERSAHRSASNRSAQSEAAARRAAANYTLAVPQFYGGRIQLLLPLCLTGDKPELALTIQREDGFYAARTCLTIEMAYNNARLICRPETSWIKR